MKPIKMLGLAVLAALMAMAFVASSAMAETTGLCTGDGSGCGVSHVHETTLSGKKALLKAGSNNVECDVLFLGDVESANNEGAPLIIEGNFTYSNCTSGCTVTEEDGPSEIEVLKLGHETADVTGEGLVKVNCSFINCAYNGLELLGTAKGPLLSTETNGEVSISAQETTEEGERILCPDEGLLTITTTPLSKTYIGKEGGCGNEKPTATTEAATFVTSHVAELHGKVNPNGCETTYIFEYGTTKEYGFTAGFGSAGSGKSNVPEETTVSGLLPGTEYHFRISATNLNGMTPGADKTFTTPAEEPSVTTEAATGVTDTGATLNGSVNPNGAETTYNFEYGTSESYGKTTEYGVVSGTSNKKVSKAISELEPETEYHFRIVASNSKGTSKGKDKTFKTKSPTWEIQTTPNPSGAKSSRLAFASCTLSTACTSVGEYVNSGGTQVPLAERWNGKEWSAQTPPSPAEASWSELLGISCTSGTSCSAAGVYEKGGARHALAEAWNGSEWAVQTTAEPGEATSTELSAISCTSSTACTAVGHYTTKASSPTLAERWNGKEWTVQTTPNPSEAKESSLLGVSCTSSTACTATGYYYDKSGTRLTLAESWNGSEWSIQSTPNRAGATKNILLGVSCTSSTACTAVGGDFPSGGGPQETLVERLSGAEWTIQTSQNPGSSEASVLHGVSCISASVCVTVGDYIKEKVNVTLAERWSSNSWALQTTLNPDKATFSALWSVACTSLTECVAPGYYKNGSETELALTENSS